MPARPYMERLISLTLLILPSTRPVLQGMVKAALTVSMSRFGRRAKEASGLAGACASQEAIKEAMVFSG